MDNIQQTTILKKWLTSEVKFILGVIVFVWGIAVPYFGIKQDIALIKENHMTHIEAFDKELAEQSKIQSEQQKMLIDLMKVVAKLE